MKILFASFHIVYTLQITHKAVYEIVCIHIYIFIVETIQIRTKPTIKSKETEESSRKAAYSMHWWPSQHDILTNVYKNKKNLWIHLSLKLPKRSFQ